MVATAVQPGPPGPQGPPGPAGSGTFAYIHTQGSPSDTWVIPHNLNGYPSVTVVDSAGTVVIGSEHYDSANQVTVSFSAPFSGQAFLS